MPRAPRLAVKDRCFHCMNRGNGRLSIFDEESDFDAFERILEEAVVRFPAIKLYAYCVMPNHWHLLLEPAEAKAMSAFVGWITITHTTRWQKHRQLVGEGHLYQGRFRSFMVQRGPHFLKVARYIERNPLRASLVERAENWRWGSLWRDTSGTADQNRTLSPWPEAVGARPDDWLEIVHQPQTESELEALRLSLRRSRPFGDAEWQKVVIEQYGQESTLRPPGRPRKKN